MNSYLITIDPPKELIETIDKYRNRYAKYTNYKIPPHITIYPPFYLKKISEKEILELIKFSLKNTNKHSLNFNSISYFEEGNNVAFFAPNKSSNNFIRQVFLKVIENLKSRVEDVYNDYKMSVKDFNPHLTIAEQIPDDMFEKFKKELNNTKENLVFECNSLCLYKQESKSRIWNKVGEIKF
ncbi:MAG: 2'-5' RNA ligase family protein [Candidatus Pacebacteria bacterium]|nr:2'-5' RNA ligase family protein [Candidatus Paceibacterota bacterium]